MTPREAAELIGCTPQQVRTLIRSGRIRAALKQAEGYPLSAPVFHYHITPSEIRRYLKLPTDGRSWKRGKVTK